jgi:hypothetical protein
MEFTKNFEDFQSMGKDGLDVAMESATAWTKAMQAIAVEVADYSKKSFEESTKIMEQASKVKSVEGAIEFHTAIAKTSYEGFIGEASKIGEMYVAAAKDAYAPIEKRVAKAA